MTRIKTGPNLLFLALVFVLALSSTEGQVSPVSVLGDDNAVLECGELTEMSQISLCLSKRLDQAKEKSAAASYGYPYRIAPTLPPFLRSGAPKRRDDKYDETRPRSVTLVRRIQGYTEPQYRNFLDLDATISQRVVEYRPIFGDFAVPVLLRQAPPPLAYEDPLLNNDYYPKPVKYSDSTPPKKYKKEYHSYKKPVTYVTANYVTGYQKAHKKGYAKDHIYKYNGGSAINSHHPKEKNYDREYYVPVNSPIIGDIRRSLMDYTGAHDLMEDEPEYYSNPAARRQMILEMGNDYSPFRRSDVLTKDLDINESQKTKTSNKEKAQ